MGIFIFACLTYFAPPCSEKNPKNIWDETVLHWAAMNGNYEILTFIGDQVEEKNPSNNHSETVLHWAAGQGDIRLIDYIAKHTSQVNHQTKYGKDTALHWAANNGKLEACKYLVEVAKCDKEIKNGQDKTAYDAAKNWGQAVDYLKP